MFVQNGRRCSGARLKRAKRANDESEMAIATLGAAVAAKEQQLVTKHQGRAEIARLRQSRAGEMGEERSESNQLAAEELDGYVYPYFGLYSFSGVDADSRHDALLT